MKGLRNNFPTGHTPGVACRWALSAAESGNLHVGKSQAHLLATAVTKQEAGFSGMAMSGKQKGMLAAEIQETPRTLVTQKLIAVYLPLHPYLLALTCAKKSSSNCSI